MKNKFISLIASITVGLVLSSCSYANLAKVTLDKLTVSDSHSAYLVGQKFFDYSYLQITGKYSDTSSKTLDFTEVDHSFTLGELECDIYSPLEHAGNYTLKVFKGSVSASLTVKVFAEEQYVSSITTIGKHSLSTGQTIDITLSISPSVYTVPVEYQSSDTNIAIVSKINDLTYRISPVGSGSVSINFSAKSGPLSYAEVSHDINVTLLKKTDILQGYDDVASNYYKSTSYCPSTGEVKILVIPVWFTDSGVTEEHTFINEAKKETVRSDIEKAYFGTKESTGWNSVASFYETESDGALHLSGVVSDWYECGYQTDTVANWNKGSNQQANLVNSATNWYFSSTGDTRSDYDSDHNGFLDAVILIYAAPDCIAYSGYGSRDNNMWAYCSWTDASSSTSNPSVKVYFWASYDFMYGDNIASSHAGSSYHRGDTSHCSIDAHTLIHEMGHTFGLDDYYDYSFTNTSGYNPAAGFSMQDSNVGGHDPFSYMSLGWADPFIPTDTTQITINDFQSSGDVILLTNNWNSYDSPYDEYLLLELYTPTGLNKFDSSYKYGGNYPQGPSSAGIRVWHVDARLISNNSGNPFTTNANFSNIAVAFNNTSDVSSKQPCKAYTFTHKAVYQNFNLLQIIRNDASASYTSRDDLRGSDLFKSGASFSMSDFAGQFYYSGKLNSNTDLNWEFSVASIVNNGNGTYSATINLTKI